MMQIKRLTDEKHINSEAGCRCRFVDSKTERLVLHTHTYFELFLIVDGSLTHIFNSQRQPLKEGSLVFIRPEDCHNFEGKAFRFVNLAFTRETLEELFFYLSDSFPGRTLLQNPQPPTVLLNRSDKESLYAKFNELNVIHWRDTDRIKLQMRMLLFDIFTQYFTVFRNVESDIPLWLENLSRQMAEPGNFAAGVSRMSELSNKSREHIARNIKKHYGKTASVFVNDIRLNYVANMLMNSKRSVIDLCFESGFQNASWFYTLFKEKYGVSPQQFRKAAKSR